MNKMNKARSREQQKAVRALWTELLRRNRAQYTMPTGMGKTRVALLLANKYKKAVVLVPSTRLVNQTIREYKKISDGRAVGSICGITPPAGAFCIPSVKEIESFTAHNSEFLIVCTYQSQHKLIEACVDHKKIDLVVCDEAHRTTGRQSKPWGRILSSEVARKFVFQTATAKTYDPTLKSNLAINCQLDEEVYGRIVYMISMKEARRRRFVTDFKISVLIDSEDLIQKKNLSRKALLGVAKVHNRTPTEYEIALVANSVREAYRQGYRKVLAYTNTRRDARFFADLLVAVQSYAKLPKLVHDKEGGRKVNVFISLQEHREARDEIIDRFSARKGLSVLFSCKTLTEGVDIPVADAALLLAPRSSQIDLTQIVGRVVRQHYSKNKPALLLIPAFVRSIDDFEKKTSFHALRSALYGLRNYDDSWQVEIDALLVNTKTDIQASVTDRLHLTTSSARLRDISLNIKSAEWETLTVVNVAKKVRQAAKAAAQKHGIQI